MSLSVPFCATITLTNANTQYNIFTLTSAIEPLLPPKAQAMILQADINAGNAKFKFGDIRFSTDLTNFGAWLQAGWSLGMDSMGSNVLVLSQMWVACDTAGQLMHVIIVPL